jgi:hypothetical protein
VGQMPLHIQLFDRDRVLLDEVYRDWSTFIEPQRHKEHKGF